MIKTITVFLISLIVSFAGFAQSYHTIMTYNLLNYPGSDTTTRNPHFRQIIAETQPDILVVQEMISQAGVDGFLNNVLKAVSTDYSSGTFINGTDTDNAVFYKSSMFTFVNNFPVSTTLRDINEFTLVNNISGDTILIYSVHLKASTGTDNEQRRFEEVTELRNRTATLRPSNYFVVAGDFNIYKSTEPAYQALLDQSTPKYFVDPLTLSGTWNNSIFSHYHTQSTRTRQFGGGATGGLDDRFDMILMSRTVMEESGITFLPGSYFTFGNDGNHYNDSINKMPNTAVTQQTANALHYASDHLPVIATFSFGEVIPVQIDVFIASVRFNDVLLEWQTVTETNNIGFYIERRPGSWNTFFGSWQQIGFVPGNGTSISLISYQFLDKNVSPGNYEYRFRQTNVDGTFEYGPSLEIYVDPPAQFTLEQNYPNPFNPETKIKYSIPIVGTGHSVGVGLPVILKVYDILGNEIATLVNEEKSPGNYEVQFVVGQDSSPDIASGMYFYRLQSDNFSETKKMILLR
ncbi:MAG: endonuclease/exonuclease/phosphatase family protein [Ignavibacteriaceae bacterium]